MRFTALCSVVGSVRVWALSVSPRLLASCAGLGKPRDTVPPSRLGLHRSGVASVIGKKLRLKSPTRPENAPSPAAFLQQVHTPTAGQGVGPVKKAPSARISLPTASSTGRTEGIDYGYECRRPPVDTPQHRPEVTDHRADRSGPTS